MQISSLPQPNSFRDDPTIFTLFCLISFSLLDENKNIIIIKKKKLTKNVIIILIL